MSEFFRAVSLVASVAGCSLVGLVGFTVAARGYPVVGAMLFAAACGTSFSVGWREAGRRIEAATTHPKE